PPRRKREHGDFSLGRSKNEESSISSVERRKISSLKTSSKKHGERTENFQKLQISPFHNNIKSKIRNRINPVLFFTLPHRDLGRIGTDFNSTKVFYLEF